MQDVQRTRSISTTNYRSLTSLHLIEVCTLLLQRSIRNSRETSRRNVCTVCTERVHINASDPSSSWCEFTTRPVNSLPLSVPPGSVYVAAAALSSSMTTSHHQRYHRGSTTSGPVLSHDIRLLSATKHLPATHPDRHRTRGRTHSQQRF